MRILLDTNIIVHREASKTYNKDIGVLFKWLDKLKYEKWIHHLTILEIEKYKDPDVVSTMKTKMDNYLLHKFDSAETTEIQNLRITDKNENDSIDTSLLKEIFSGKFDILISQDKKLFKKSIILGIQHKVLSIDAFLEKVNQEFPGLRDYNVLAARLKNFGQINLDDPFFDSFKEDYEDFKTWFLKKAENEAYVCESDQEVRAFLYVKVEDKDESYSDISPSLPPKKRLKIGTLKVESTGYKLGERFLKIIFDNAMLNKVDEIYVTIFDKREEQKRLIELLESWGFSFWGTKTTKDGFEQVWTRQFLPPDTTSDSWKKQFPFMSRKANKFFVPIKPEYHTILLPDSKLNNENYLNYTENKSFSNAIQKVYINRYLNKLLKPGDILVFYRMKGNGPAKYTSVITSLAIVEKVFSNIKNLAEFLSICKRRTVFSDEELVMGWEDKNNQKKNKPYVVHFLFTYSFPKRLNLGTLIDLEIVSEAPRGYQQISDEQFEQIIKHTQSDENFIID